MQLPGLSNFEDSDNIPMPVGYAIPWCNASQELMGKGDQDITLISSLLLVTSKLIIIVFCYELFHQLCKHTIHRKTNEWYHIYWATQILIIIGMAWLINFARKNQKNRVTGYIFYSSLSVDAVLTIISISGLFVLAFCRRKHSNLTYNVNEEQIEVELQHADNNTEPRPIKPDPWNKIAIEGRILNSLELVPPPLSPLCFIPLCCILRCFICCILKCCPRSNCCNKSTQGPPGRQQQTALHTQWEEDWYIILWTIITNAVSLLVFLGLFSYLTQAIPAVAVSYYLNPTASLIRLGFFEVSVVILIMEIAYALFLVEKFTWLWYIHWNKQIPEEIVEENKKTGNKYRYVDIYLNNKRSELVSLVDSEKCCSCSCNNCCCKCFHWLLLTAFSQIIVFGFVIYLSWRLLHFLMIIIIDQTSNPNNQFKDILAILPTIALNGWLLFKKGNIMRALKDVVSKANKSIIEHGNECDTPANTCYGTFNR